MKIMLINKTTAQLFIESVENHVIISYFSIFDTSTHESESISLKFSKNEFSRAIKDISTKYIINEGDNNLTFIIHDNNSFDMSINNINKSFHIEGVECNFETIRSSIL